MLVKIKFEDKESGEIMPKAHYSDHKHLPKVVEYLHLLYSEKYTLIMEDVKGAVDFNMSSDPLESEREHICGLAVHPEDKHRLGYLVAAAEHRNPTQANTFSDLTGNSFHLSDFRISKLKEKLGV